MTNNSDLDEIRTQLTKMDAAISHVITSSEKELKEHSEKLDKFDERLRATETNLSSKTSQITTIEGWEDGIDRIEKRVRTLENWKWFLTGGIIILGAIIYYASNMIISLLHNGVQK